MIISRTVSLPELLWTVWCSAGLMFLLKLVWNAVQDWQWVIATGRNGVREYTAVTSVLIFAAMSITQLVFVVAGIVAMTLPTPVANSITPLTYVLTGLFMCASAAKSILAFIIHTRKDHLIDRIESGQWTVETNCGNKNKLV